MNAVPQWDWASFWGSSECLKFLRRDLPSLDAFCALVRHRGVAVQAGGCLGLFAKRLAETFEVVYSFEPSADLFPMMVSNAPERNIVRMQLALGEYPSLVATSQTRRSGGDGRCHEGITHVSGAGYIPMIRLDDLRLQRCDYLMLDIEGDELPALRGALETLSRCRPVVAIEVNKNLKYVGITEDDIQTFMLAHGYRHVLNVGSDQAFVPVEWE